MRGLELSNLLRAAPLRIRQNQNPKHLVVKIDMADSPFQLAARRRYRYATITGDGEWGVVARCHIAKKVRLCPTEIEANRLAALRCSAVPCRDDHVVERFEHEPIPQPVWDSHIWERD